MIMEFWKILYLATLPVGVFTAYWVFTDIIWKEIKEDIPKIKKIINDEFTSQKLLRHKFWNDLKCGFRKVFQ